MLYKIPTKKGLLRGLNAKMHYKKCYYTAFKYLLASNSAFGLDPEKN